MKTFLNNVTKYLLLFSIIAILFFYNGYKNRGIEIAELKTTQDELIWACDSISKIPDDTVGITDTVYIKSDPVYVYKELSPPPPTAKMFSDRLVNDSIDVKVSVIADNVYSWSYEYTPIKTKIILHDVIYKNRPVPYIKYVDKQVQDNGLFVGAGIIFADRFAGKLELNYLTKKNTIWGVEAMRYGDKTFYGAKYAVKIGR